jgi:phosphatidylserine synthase
MKIDTKMHGAIDYAMAFLLLLLPYMLSLDEPQAENNVLYILGTSVLVYSMITDYELGLLKLLPFRVHLLLDAAGGIVLACSPWLFGFADRIWLPYVVLGAVSLIVVLLTDCKKKQSNLIG